ncbi:disease resistance protein RPM1-like [Miscanthus floridulus]|uniref:disease resistance protein RPM1-like n=1 Tax=Miscanthus floridulus TaxID=154761 RepID=UPI003459CD2E
MEATAMSLGKAVLGGALSYAKSKAAEEVALQLGVEDDVIFITDELQMMQSFLMAADEERSQSKVLTTWVTQVRDLAYNVEDSLMDFGLHTGKKPIWGCIPRNLCDRRRIAKEVKKLRAKVEDVSNRNLRYRLIKDGSNSRPAGAADQADSDGAAVLSINQAMITAVEQKKSKADLLQLLTAKEVELRVMAVWGTISDLGKTAAIHEVYDDPRVTSMYGCRAWVRLIHPFNPKEFIHSMVRQFFENFHDQGGEEVTNVGASVLLKMENMNQSDLVHTLTAQLSSNSYLVVINDLRTVEEWQCIRRYFPDNKKQSRVIVSTQQVEVARLCTEQPYQMSELKHLPYDQTLYLFHKKNSEEWTTTAGISKFEENEAKPADLVEGKSNVNHRQLINNEHPKKVALSSEPVPICDPATPSSEIQEEYQEPESTGANNFFTSTAGKKFDRTRTIALIDDVLVGRKTEKSIVIDLIGQPMDMQGCKVISVWGMGGLGKTTLVRSIYRSQELGGWKRAWVTALRPFNPEVLIRTLALQLLTDDPTVANETKQERKNLATMRLDDLPEKLNQLLEEHECLIVLDDLSSTKEWDLIRGQLAKAKRIIVTTRENSVARYCSGGDMNTHKLQVLHQEEALALFMKKVFKDNVEKYYLGPDMLDQAALILKKCHGLPLAISTIGGFLATKPKITTEWRKVNDHIRVELDINPKLRTIKTVLMRSYDGLPYHLKSAFLYMSIFPEDYKIKRKRLIRRWIAEGYCREMRGITAEEVGDKYFDELFDRSMILLCEGEIQYGGAIDSCQLHDLIREICMLKAREENLAFTLEEGCCLSDAQGTIRHLVIGSNWKRDKDVLESMVDLSHVRSLTVFGDWKTFFISDKGMRFLRVLDLGDTLGLRDHHLDEVGQLFHLRYLSIRGCCNIFCLPSSLGNLRHLQTLDGRGTKIVRLPSTIAKLQKLEHLLASDDDLERRQQGGVEAPRGMRKLKALRTLGVVNVARSKTTLKELQELTQLRKLGVAGVYSKKFWSAISGHKQLRSLSVKGHGLDSYLGGDLLPPIHLESLKLEGKLVRVIEWINKLQNLLKLQLEDTKIDSAVPIQAIGQLPNLKVLDLRFGAFTVTELLFHGPSFPSLMVLEYRVWLPDVLLFKEHAMPKLELINFDDSGLMGMQGLAFLASLKEIRTQELDDHSADLYVSVSWLAWHEYDRMKWQWIARLN